MSGRPSSDTPGAVESPPHIHDHELLCPIGQGSYGEVWLARNAVGTLRAVKIVHRQSFERVEHFEREFKGLQKFEPISRSHDGLVDILQIGRDDAAGYFYYVMELADSVSSFEFRVSGSPGRDQLETQNPKPETYVPKTLRSGLQLHGPLPVSDCIKIGLALASALEHLHAHGLVHRDIKPSNIIFVDGKPKLADIGLVAHIDDARSLVGTAGYIPPEGPGTPQADLYSLGKVLYEISLGKDRQDFPQLPPDLQSHPDHVALLELNEVILKACETDPRRRYQTAQQMHDDLALLQRGESVKQKRTTQRWFALGGKLGLAAAAVVVLIALLPYVKLGKPKRNNSAPLAEINSIAVLPFVNENTNWVPHQYLCDALTVETMNALTNCPGLRVASGAAVFAFKRATNDLRQVGKQLGVRTVLAGSMKKSSNHLYIAARLVNVPDGAQLWSASFDRDAAELGAIQSEVVRQVVQQLNLSLDDRALRRLETNLVRKLAAYQLLSQTRSIRDDTREGLNKIIQLLNRAIVEDPNFGQPYARLAHFYAETAGWMLPPDIAMTTAKQNALRAIQLDDSLAEAHMALGNVFFHHELDFAKAEVEFQHGIEVDPRYHDTYGFYSILLSRLGRFGEAEELLSRGDKVFHNAQVIVAGWCWRYYLERRFDEMLRAATNYLAVYPNHTLGLEFLGWAHERLGHYDEALTTAQRLVQLTPDPEAVALLGRIHARMGHRIEAQKALEELRVISQSPRGSPLYSAQVLLALGDKDQAIEQLQRAVEEYSPTAFRLQTDPFWDDLRSDLRFAALLEKMGLKK